MSMPSLAKAAALALLAGALLSPTASAHRHTEGGGSLEPPGMSEKKLRAFETAVLGPEHAAEHARERRVEATTAARASSTPLPPPTNPAGNASVIGRWDRWDQAFPQWA